MTIGTDQWPAELRERLGKLVPVLGNANDNEVLTAARAIEAALRGEGRDLHDLGRLVSSLPPAGPFDALWETLFLRSRKELGGVLKWTLQPSDVTFVEDLELRMAGAGRATVTPAELTRLLDLHDRAQQIAGRGGRL